MPNIVFAHEIIDNLWLGDINSARDAVFIKTQNISLVVNCTMRHCIPTFYDSMGVSSIRLPIYDSDEKSNMKVFVKHKKYLIEQIHNFLIAKRPVLIHCRHGIQRSATLVAFYIISKFNVKPQQAITIIKSKRPISFGLTPTFKDILNV